MVYEKGKNFNEISPTSSDSIISQYNLYQFCDETLIPITVIGMPHMAMTRINHVALKRGGFEPFE
jgi:hypothetical protein